MRYAFWWFGGFGFGVWRTVDPQGQIWSISIGPLTVLIAELKKDTCAHEPLLELNGKKIDGTHRCIYCGLNEAYWNK